MSFLTPPAHDTIYLSALSLTTLILPGDIWSRPSKPTPVSLTLRLRLPPLALAAPASSDNVAQTVSYGVLAKGITSAVSSHPGAFASIREFARFVSRTAGGIAGRGKVEVEVELKEGLLLAEGVWAGGVWDAGEGKEAGETVLGVNGLRVACVVGVNPHERLQKQWVVIGVRMWGVPKGLWTGYPEAVGRVAAVVAESAYLTIETLATEVARVLCVEFGVRRAQVAVEKPSALTFAKGSGVEVVRERGFFV